MSQLNKEVATEFEYYIRNNPLKEHDPCKGNGVGKHIQRFKRIINWAVDDLEWLKTNPINDYSCPLKKSRRKKLDIQQLVTLEQKIFLDGSYLKEIAKIERQHLPILDDFGIEPFDTQSRVVLMELIEDRHGKGALIITSQVPVNKWFDIRRTNYCRCYPV